MGDVVYLFTVEDLSNNTLCRPYPATCLCMFDAFIKRKRNHSGLTPNRKTFRDDSDIRFIFFPQVVQFKWFSNVSSANNFMALSTVHVIIQNTCSPPSALDRRTRENRMCAAQGNESPFDEKVG